MDEVEYRAKLIERYNNANQKIWSINAILEANVRSVGVSCESTTWTAGICGPGKSPVSKWKEPIRLPVSAIPAIRRVLLTMRESAKAEIERMKAALRNPERIELCAPSNGDFSLEALAAGLELSRTSVMHYENSPKGNSEDCG